MAEYVRTTKKIYRFYGFSDANMRSKMATHVESLGTVKSVYMLDLTDLSMECIDKETLLSLMPVRDDIAIRSHGHNDISFASFPPIFWFLENLSGGFDMCGGSVRYDWNHINRLATLKINGVVNEINIGVTSIIVNDTLVALNGKKAGCDYFVPDFICREGSFYNFRFVTPFAPTGKKDLVLSFSSNGRYTGAYRFNSGYWFNEREENTSLAKLALLDY